MEKYNASRIIKKLQEKQKELVYSKHKDKEQSADLELRIKKLDEDLEKIKYEQQQIEICDSKISSLEKELNTKLFSKKYQEFNSIKIKVEELKNLKDSQSQSYEKLDECLEQVCAGHGFDIDDYEYEKEPITIDNSNIILILSSSEFYDYCNNSLRGDFPDDEEMEEFYPQNHKMKMVLNYLNKNLNNENLALKLLETIFSLKDQKS